MSKCQSWGLLPKYLSTIATIRSAVMSFVQVIQVPPRLTFETASKFVCMLGEVSLDFEHYVLDFNGVGRVEPFALLYLGSEIQRFNTRLGKGHLSVRNHNHMTYADHMGFFRSFRVEGAKKENATGSHRYIPIKIKNVKKLTDRAFDEGKEVGDVIEDSCEDLASMLSRSHSGVLFDTLAYSFREIMRNVVEHSNAKQFAFCSQYWPTYNKVEVAILDRGNGIKQSLKRNPNLEIENDHDALNFALMPGISGRAYKGAPKQRGHWVNSGYGLYMTSRLARQGGSFFIASGDTGMYLSEGKRKHLETPFERVALNLSFDVNRLSELNASLCQFKDEAAEIAGKYKGRKNLEASVASVMLRRDFRNDS
jgi:anti-anti-sigma regulatory factor